jgi:hypothetical protein
MPFDVRTVTPMPTRPCRLCVALQDDSVFADFDIDPDGCLYLVRISFDGYGCCHTAERVGSMNAEDTRNLIDFNEQSDVNRSEIRGILCRYFRENKEAMWSDALEAHNLLND